ncbi:MAG: M17 family peptidase N-terminal domain-containing protein, partial [Patescibacteria group bacterium]
MEMHVNKFDGLNQKTDILIVSATQIKQTIIQGVLKEIDKTLNGLITQVMKEESYLAKANQLLWVRTEGKLPFKRILIVGLGKNSRSTGEEVDLETMRTAAATSLHAIKTTTARHVVFVLPNMVNLDVREIAHAMTEGIELAAYSFDRYKKQKKNHLQSFDLAVQDGRDVLASKKGMERARLFSHGTCFVRDLVNTTPHHMNPSELVQVAKKIAKESKDVRVSVYDESQLKRMGAGGIIGVAQGSTHPPYLVHLTYKPKTKTKKRIALVGKG